MILFLDFDGVLHRSPVGTNIDRYFERIGLLAAWMREHAEVQIVVSSSWRTQYSLEELRDLLFHDRLDLQDRVVGVNPDLSRLYSEHVRSTECQLWLNDNDHPFSAWVALDDEAVRFCPLLHDEHLVVCSPAVGLTSESLDQAWRNLQRQRLAEPTRRARGERNGAPLSPSQRYFLQALSHPSSRISSEMDIKPMTELEEAQIAASIVTARADMDVIDRAVAAAAAARNAAWLALPETECYSTVFLDLDEVLCIGQPYAAGDLLKSMADGAQPDAQLLRMLFAPAATAALEHVHQQMEGRLRYVISSSWRQHFSREQLELVFRKTGLGFVADNLHAGPAWRCYQAWLTPDRKEDLEDWVEKFHAGEPFVIVDDRHSGGGLNFHRQFVDHKFFGRVVLCEAGVGLTAGHVDQIVAALRRSV